MIQFQKAANVVQLKSPNFSDTRGVRLNTTFKRARDGTRWSFAAPDPLIRVIDISFDGLSRDQTRNFFEFMRQTKGKAITMLFTPNPGNPVETWQGSIISEPVASTHSGINNSNLSITFEGVKVA